MLLKIVKQSYKETSISKKLLNNIEFLKVFVITLFIKILMLRPFLLSELIYNVASNIWYDIGDKSQRF